MVRDFPNDIEVNQQLRSGSMSTERISLSDSGQSPTSNGEVRLNGSTVEVFTDGSATAVGGGGGILQSAIQNSEPIADDGNTYSTIQAAIDAAADPNGWVYIPPGTYNEDVTVSKAGITVEGAGPATRVNGGANNTFFFDTNAPDATIKNLHVTGGNYGVYFAAPNGTAENLRVDDDDSSLGDRGIRCNDGGGRIRNCVIENAGNHGIQLTNDTDTSPHFVVNVEIINPANRGLYNARQDGSRYLFVHVDGAGDTGIFVRSDSMAVGCTARNCAGDGFQAVSNDNHVIVGSQASGNTGEQFNLQDGDGWAMSGLIGDIAITGGTSTTTGVESGAIVGVNGQVDVTDGNFENSGTVISGVANQGAGELEQSYDAPAVHQSAPSTTYVGMSVLADGTNWNPAGTGNAAKVTWNGTAWEVEHEYSNGF